MAIDTETKRRRSYVVGFGGLPWMRSSVLPYPDSTIGRLDRASLLGIYNVAEIANNRQVSTNSYMTTDITEDSYMTTEISTNSYTYTDIETYSNMDY